MIKISVSGEVCEKCKDSVLIEVSINKEMADSQAYLKAIGAFMRELAEMHDPDIEEQAERLAEELR